MPTGRNEQVERSDPFASITILSAIIFVRQYGFFGIFLDMAETRHRR